ncbi:SDR family oxidoreductase [Streptomyces sp. NPDC006798]|uniref:SDR family oxidoreductase n=1 Tax=Streptomyces sp. NPDC006798 TaxID=3155462 RepID=UPI003407269F
MRTGGVELCVAEAGDAERPTVVLIHGYPDSKEVWSEVVGRLAGEHGFHVVLYDVRGHGRSSAPRPLRGGFTLEKLTDDFLAVVDEVSPGRPVHVVGHDWGSVQAWEFVTVRRAEGRIASFTSISGPCLDHMAHWRRQRTARPTPRAVAQLLRQNVRSWYIYVMHTPVLPERAWRGPLGRAWPGLIARREKVTGGGYPAPSLPDDGAHGIWLYRDNVRARMSRPRPDAYAHAPVQLIVPDEDPYLSPRLYDGLEKWAPGLTRRSLAAGHWVPRTRPDQLCSWIADFVRAREKAPPAAVPVADGAAAASAEVTVHGSVPVPVPGSGPYAERFGGRLVLVTGAASGIGRATALAFAVAGARVVAVDLDAEGAARTAERARALGAASAWSEQVDVADETAMEKLAGKVAGEYGVVDVLVNNAGIGVAGPFLETAPEDWRRVLDVNLWGVIHGCRLFGRQMAERGQGGHIVNIASAAAYQPLKSLSAYGTSKAAVLMLSQSLRAELAGRDIGVTAVCPGIVNTGITSTTRFTGVDAAEERRLRRKSARLYRLRNYAPEKVAEAILRAVVRDSAVVPVTPEARGALLMSRFAPRLLRGISRLEPPL